jgi:hypothetical protein
LVVVLLFLLAQKLYNTIHREGIQYNSILDKCDFFYFLVMMKRMKIAEQEP